jgi:hypothetical protein
MGDYDLGSLSKLTSETTQATKRLTEDTTEATKQLTKALEKASTDSGIMARRIVWLTIALVAVGLAQAIATAWPYIDWSLKHWR